MFRQPQDFFGVSLILGTFRKDLYNGLNGYYNYYKIYFIGSGWYK